MTYIKHNGSFYKKVELEDLTKEELVELITKAIEVEPRIIERWNSYPIYRDRYPRWNNGIWCQNNSSGTLYSGDVSGDTITMSSLDSTLHNNLLSMQHNDLVTLCNTI